MYSKDNVQTAQSIHDMNRLRLAAMVHISRCAMRLMQLAASSETTFGEY
jgi:hypothetical protein